MCLKSNIATDKLLQLWFKCINKWQDNLIYHLFFLSIFMSSHWSMIFSIQYWWKLTTTSKIAPVLARQLKGQIIANEWSGNHRPRPRETERWAKCSVLSAAKKIKTIPPLGRWPAPWGEEKRFHLLWNTAVKKRQWEAKHRFGIFFGPVLRMFSQAYK